MPPIDCYVPLKKPLLNPSGSSDLWLGMENMAALILLSIIVLKVEARIPLSEYSPG